MHEYEDTLAFVAKIKESSEYQEYLSTRAILVEQESLWYQVEEFRRRSFEIQVSKDYGAYNAYERLVGLKQEFETVLNEVDVKRFLEAELKFSKLVAMISDTIASEIEFDIGFLE